jgi:hypothetical protein
MKHMAVLALMGILLIQAAHTTLAATTLLPAPIAINYPSGAPINIELQGTELEAAVNITGVEFRAVVSGSTQTLVVGPSAPCEIIDSESIHCTGVQSFPNQDTIEARLVGIASDWVKIGTTGVSLSADSKLFSIHGYGFGSSAKVQIRMSDVPSTYWNEYVSPCFFCFCFFASVAFVPGI